MKIRDLNYRERQIRDCMSAEKACEKLLAGDTLKAMSLNGLLYNYGFLDEDAICIHVECGHCPFLGGAHGCTVNSNAYVKDLISSKLTVREPIDDVL